jgi:transcriptional regulator with XRE-family HTH domain
MVNNKLINLKQELKALLNNFDDKNNKYSNSEFIKSIVLNELVRTDITGTITTACKATITAPLITTRALGAVVAGAISGAVVRKPKEHKEKNSEQRDSNTLITNLKIDYIKKELEKRRKNEKFNVYLQRIIIERNLSNSTVIERANLDKSYFYQIMRGEKTPSKDRLIQIAIALNLNIKETNNMLMMQGHVLYGENPRDFIILFCIENNLDLIVVNHMLDEFEEKLLASAS